MPEISREESTAQLLAVLAEAFEGPGEKWSYFTDHGPEAGLFGTLEKLSAAEASRPVGGTSVAAHAHHVSFGLDAASAWIRGDQTSRDWSESWRVSAVDERAWSGLKEQLRERHGELRRAIESHAFSGVEAMGGALGAIAHAAYHLGAIRQKIVGSRRV